MGGALASNYAANNPAKVKSLILNVPFVGTQTIGLANFVWPFPQPGFVDAPKFEKHVLDKKSHGKSTLDPTWVNLDAQEGPNGTNMGSKTAPAKRPKTIQQSIDFGRPPDGSEPGGGVDPLILGPHPSRCTTVPENQKSGGLQTLYDSEAKTSEPKVAEAQLRMPGVPLSQATGGRRIHQAL